MQEIHQDDQTELLNKVLQKQELQDKKLESILKSLKKNKWRKIWSFVKKIIWLVLIVGFLVALGSGFEQKNPLVLKEHIAKINIYGEISADKPANSENIIHSLRDAVQNSKANYIVLDINSPGGSPVQAALIYEAIMKYKQTKPIYAVIGDLGASGAYYIASAATHIIAHKSSLVGSIGVISTNFGLKGLVEKLGIEPRIITSGENKAFLNQFEDMNAEQKQHWQRILNQTHQDFIDDVKKARGNKIIREAKVFSGLIFSAKDAKNYGLIDDLGSLYELQEKYKNLPMVDYTYEPDFWDKLYSFSTNLTQGLFNNKLQAKIQ